MDLIHSSLAKKKKSLNKASAVPSVVFLHRIATPPNQLEPPQSLIRPT